jgi:hypothetical protein
MDDFTDYEALRDQGEAPHEVYEAAKARGLDFISCILMLRSVFNLGLLEAKEIIMQVDEGVKTLSDHQERCVPMVEIVLEKIKNEDRQRKKALLLERLITAGFVLGGLFFLLSVIPAIIVFIMFHVLS